LTVGRAPGAGLPAAPAGVIVATRESAGTADADPVVVDGRGRDVFPVVDGGDEVSPGPALAGVVEADVDLGGRAEDWAGCSACPQLASSTVAATRRAVAAGRRPASISRSPGWRSG
jgi:hypothetical protein